MHAGKKCSVCLFFACFFKKKTLALVIKWHELGFLSLYHLFEIYTCIYLTINFLVFRKNLLLELNSAKQSLIIKLSSSPNITLFCPYQISTGQLSLQNQLSIVKVLSVLQYYVSVLNLTKLWWSKKVSAFFGPHSI